MKNSIFKFNKAYNEAEINNLKEKITNIISERAAFFISYKEEIAPYARNLKTNSEVASFNSFELINISQCQSFNYDEINFSSKSIRNFSHYYNYVLEKRGFIIFIVALALLLLMTR